MAVYNEILVGRFSRMLQKFFAMKGGVPAKQLAGEITVAFPLFNGVENRYLEGWQRFGKDASVAAGAAGQFATILLRNPANSGVLAVIEKALAANTTGGGINALLDYGATLPGADLGTVFTPQILDRRGGSQTGSALKMTAGNPAGGQVIGTEIALVTMNSLSLETWDFISNDDQELPLLPGDGIQLSCSVAATAFAASFWWRQRPLEESEST